MASWQYPGVFYRVVVRIIKKKFDAVFPTALINIDWDP